MTHNEYEQAKHRLEDSRRAGLDLVEAAYQSQLRALDMVRDLLAGTADVPLPTAPPAASPPAVEALAPPPPPRRQQRAGDVAGDFRRIYRQLPETFGRNDIHALLGYEPDRGALYRILAALSTRKVIFIETVSLGRRPAVYRKLAADLPPDR
ncbi:MAG TPA: hypothetical protein VIE43_24145 [Thermoanaerobaculia bacterium]|jgi:hypothetical protein|nr:hypothetical protein [Thermoanaerobaculia bacterium]